MRCSCIEKRDKILLQKIIDYCQRISDNLSRYDHDFSAFTTDHLFQDACCMCVVQIGELVSRLSPEVCAQNPAIPWRIIKDTRNFYVQDDAALAANPLSQQNVVDSYMTRSSGGSFSAAVEYRVGKGRVQGVFGGGLLYAFSYDRSKYEYGNAITSMNQQPTVSNDMTGAIMRNDIPDGFSYMRYLSKFGDTPTNYFGLVAFAGIEWFVAPRISLGGEVNLAAVFNWTKATYYTAEGFNTVSGAPETWTELLSPKSTGFHFGTGNIGQNISVTFYF